MITVLQLLKWMPGIIGVKEENPYHLGLTLNPRVYTFSLRRVATGDILRGRTEIYIYQDHVLIWPIAFKQIVIKQTYTQCFLTTNY